MKKTVHLTLDGVQQYPDGGKTTTSLTASGEYYQKNHSHYLIFEEPSPEDPPPENPIPLKSMLKFRDGLMEYHRKGAACLRLVLEEGAEHMTEYATPFGVLFFGVETHSVKTAEAPEEMQVTADYSLTLDGKPFARCRIQVNMRSFSGNISP